MKPNYFFFVVAGFFTPLALLAFAGAFFVVPAIKVILQSYAIYRSNIGVWSYGNPRILESKEVFA